MRKTSDRQGLLLDTHIWFWLVLGDATLSSGTRRTISRAASAGNLRIAAITLWEIALLASRKRLVLGKPTILWIEEAVTLSNVVIEPLSASIAVESCELPEAFHSDPADRLIVATARVTDAALMTRDRHILNYATQGHLTAIAA